MTKTGVAFTVTAVIGYFVASQTQIGWLYLFDAAIWGVLLLSALVSWHGVRSLHVTRQVLLPVVASSRLPLNGPLEGDTVEVRLKVTSRGRFSRYFISLFEECPFDMPENRQKNFFLTRLIPGSVIAISYSAECYRRGYYASAGVTLQAGAPLGLFRGRRTFVLPLRLTVYPRYYPMEGLPTAFEAWAEQGRALKTGTASEFYGSREYRFGDPLKHIHWRNTARTGGFMLKEFEQTGQGSLSVVFDTGRDFGAEMESTFEYSIRIAASLAALCAASGRGIDILAGHTPLHNAGWPEAMDYLAHLEAGEGSNLTEFFTFLAPGRTVVAVVPATDAALLPLLETLAGRVGGLIVVLLERFSPDEAPHDIPSGLSGRNLTIVRCSRGNLAPAIENLRHSLAGVGAIPAPLI